MGASNRTIVLWIRGLTWEMLDRIPVVDALRSQGATVTALEPLPITGPRPQAWQMMSGQTPGHSGFFDTWFPRQYSALPAGEPEMPLVHESVAAAGRAAACIDLAVAEVPAYLSTCAPVVECLVLRAAHRFELAALERAIEAARSWAGADGAFFLLSDHQEAAVSCYVNLNNAFHTLEVLEISGQQTICWEETLAYHAGHGQIWVNLEGREPLGVVAPGEEYEQVCQILVRSLPVKLLDPRSGEPVIERVYRRDEIYQGDYLFRAPDLVALLRPGYAPSAGSVAAGLDDAAAWPAPAGTRGVSGLHPMAVAGLALAAGAPFVPGQVVARSPLTYIAPTILHTLHLPLPASMDAEVISELFTPAFMQHYPVQRADSGSNLSAEDEREILARLKSLGYLG